MLLHGVQIYVEECIWKLSHHGGGLCQYRFTYRLLCKNRSRLLGSSFARWHRRFVRRAPKTLCRRKDFASWFWLAHLKEACAAFSTIRLLQCSDSSGPHCFHSNWYPTASPVTLPSWDSFVAEGLRGTPFGDGQ